MVLFLTLRFQAFWILYDNTFAIDFRYRVSQELECGTSSVELRHFFMVRELIGTNVCKRFCNLNSKEFLFLSGKWSTCPVVLDISCHFQGPWLRLQLVFYSRVSVDVRENSSIPHAHPSTRWSWPHPPLQGGHGTWAWSVITFHVLGFSNWIHHSENQQSHQIAVWFLLGLLRIK